MLTPVVLITFKTTQGQHLDENNLIFGGWRRLLLFAVCDFPKGPVGVRGSRPSPCRIAHCGEYARAKALPGREYRGEIAGAPIMSSALSSTLLGTLFPIAPSRLPAKPSPDQRKSTEIIS